MPQWRLHNYYGSQITDGGFRYLSLEAFYDPTVEAEVQGKFYVAYTVTDIRVYVSTWTTAGTPSIPFRDDGVSSSNVVVSPLATGWIEDTTGSDTPAADSLVSIH